MFYFLSLTQDRAGGQETARLGFEAVRLNWLCEISSNILPVEGFVLKTSNAVETSCTRPVETRAANYCIRK